MHDNKNQLEGCIGKKPCGKRHAAACWAAAIALMILIAGCKSEKPPIKVGFAGGLTGRYSDLGTAGRNGVVLAVEEINADGGINGRPVELITKDDRQDPQTAVQVDKELIQEGVVAIIGHMTSAMTLAAVPLINAEKKLMISPTTSTSQLTGVDDWFLRAMVPTGQLPRKLAEYARTDLKIDRIAAICDMANRAYAKDYVAAFESRFEELGGHMTAIEPFTAGGETRFDVVIPKLMEAGPDGVLIAAGALDTAMICQHVRKINAAIPIFSSGWALTQEFIHNGGRAAESVVFAEFIDRNAQQDTYIKFKNSFINRFGSEPNFAAVFSYETAHMLFAALMTNPDVRELKTTLLRQKTFAGVQGEFEIDAYGDARRRFFLITVSEGQFKTME